MTDMNISDLAQIAKALLDAKTNGQEFMLNDVHNIVREAYERYPEDSVIRQVAFTIERMAEKAPPGKTITQASISGIYNHFVRLGENSKFRNILGHLLLEDRTEFNSQNPDYTQINRVDANDSGLTSNNFTDPDAVDALMNVFDKDIGPIKAYNSKIAERGIEFVMAELRSLGFDKPMIKVLDGNEDTLVYAVNFDTHRGPVTVTIPAEIKNGQVLFPSTFVADDHLEELTASKLNDFISKKSESVNTDCLYEEPKADINVTPEVEMPQELAHLSRDFENDVLEAVSSFGIEAIRKGKEIIARELISAGFKNAQVKFGSESTNSVVYLATINTPKGPAEIEVPLEICATEDKFIPLAPTYFAYDGIIESFTAPKLQRFAISIPEPSSKNISYSSAHSYMLLPEIKDEILKAASNGDYVTCESALAEIEERFTEEDFKNAIADYHYILMQKSHLENQEQKSCSKMIPAGKGSIYARCGHFGVPMHQTVTDSEGNCRLKTAMEREKLNPAEESGAVISTSKLNLT